MSKETAFYGKLAAMTDEWMDLWALTVVSDTLAEYRACREAAASWTSRCCARSRSTARGVELVNGIVTRDVSKLTPGQIAYGALCNADGKMIDDCTSMMRSADSVRFCGANDRDHELFAAAARAGESTCASTPTRRPTSACRGRAPARSSRA